MADDVKIRLSLKGRLLEKYRKMTGGVVSNNKQVENSMNRAKAASSGFSTAIRSVVAAFGGFMILRAVNNLVRESIKLFGEQAEAEAKVEQTIKATGMAAGVTLQEMKKMASGLQEVTTWGDEVILRGQSMLLTFKNLSKDILPGATEMMLDLATAMQTDVKEAAIQLGKALNDPITGLTALRRVGITFDEQQTATIKKMQQAGDMAGAQRLIMEELESQFGGLARSVAEIGTGPLVQFENKVGDVKEKLGGSFLPAVLSVVRVLDDVIDRGVFDQWAEGFNKILFAMGVLEHQQGKTFLATKAQVASAKALTKGLQVARLELEANSEALDDFGIFTNFISGHQVELKQKIIDSKREIKDMTKALQEFIPNQVIMASTDLNELLERITATSKDLGATQEEMEKKAEAARAAREKAQALATAEADAKRRAEKAAATARAAAAKEAAEMEAVADTEKTQALFDYLDALEEAGDKINVLTEIKRKQAETDKWIGEQDITTVEDIIDANEKLIQSRRESTMQFMSNLQTAFGASKKFAAAQKLVAITEAGYSTYLSAQKMFEAGTKFPYPVSLVMPWVLSAAAVAAGLANIANIKSFAEGGIQSTPGVANIAEYGPEAIIPLKNGAVPVRIEGGGGQGITIQKLYMTLPAGASGEMIDTFQEQLAGMAQNQNEIEVLQVGG